MNNKSEKNFCITWPPQGFNVALACGIVYGWKIGVISFLAIGLIYTVGGGK